MTAGFVETFVAISYLGAGVIAIWLGDRDDDRSPNISSLAIFWLGYMSLASALFGGESRTLAKVREVGRVGLLLTGAYVVGVLVWLS